MSRIPNGVQEILKRKIYHEQKVFHLKQLLEKDPDNAVIMDFVRAEEHLVKKKGFQAAKVYEEIALKTGEPRWLMDRLARTLAKYAYRDIGSGPIEKAHMIFTQKLGQDPEHAWKTIADILKRVKGWGYAAQCYANADMPGTAARMFEKQLRQPQKAAWYYEQAEEWLPAARMYKKAKLFDQAGNCYVKAKMMKNAVKMWKKADTLEKHNVGEQMMEQIMRK
jgi:tetratricopeptide (TPR) repeat protein